MVDPLIRTQKRLGGVLHRLSQLQPAPSAGPDISRPISRSVADLLQVANELDAALTDLKQERARLKSVAGEAETTMLQTRKLLEESPNACLVLERYGAAIAEANAAACRLLNVSQRHLIGRTFTTFLHQDREIFMRQLRHTDEARADRWPVTLRPRERAVLRMFITAIADSQDTAAIVLSPIGNPSVDGQPEYAGMQRE